jgi:hypothetical protein
MKSSNQETITVVHRRSMYEGALQQVMARLDGKKTVSLTAKLMLIFIALYISELGVFSLSIDEEFAAFRDAASPAWVTQGRWTIYLVQVFLLPQTTIPYLPLVIFGVFSALGYLLIVRAHEGRDPIFRHYYLFPVFVAFPTWFFIIEFYTNLPGIGVGLFASCISVHLFAKMTADMERGGFVLADQKWRLVGAFASIAIALGCYQSFLFFVVSACAGVMLMRLMATERGTKFPWSGLLLLIILAVGGTLLYYVIWKAFLLVLDVQVEYIQGFLNIDALLNDPLGIMKRTFDEAWKIYGGSKDVYGQSSIAVGVLLAVSSVLIVVQLTRKGVAAVIAGILLLGAVLMAPFALHLLSSGTAAYRSMVAIPYVVWLCGTLMVTNRVHIVRAAGFALVGFIIFESLYTLSLFQASNHLVRDHDRLLAQQAYTRIVAANPSFDTDKPAVVEFFGYREFQTPFPRIWSSTVGQSFFEWDYGNPYRINAFMKLLGYGNLDALPVDRRSEFIKDLYAMPVWPSEGSVKVVRGVTLVRLSKKPGLLHQSVNIPFSVAGDDVLFRLSNLDQSARDAIGLKGVRLNNGVLILNSKRRSQLLIPLDAEQARSCKTIQINVTQELQIGGALRAYYRLPGEKNFTGANQYAVHQPAGRRETTMFLQANEGFEPTLRLDPVHIPQTVKLSEIAIGCIQRR